MIYVVEYARPNAAFSACGGPHETAESALYHMRQAAKSAQPGGTVRVVDGDGETLASITKENACPA